MPFQHRIQVSKPEQKQIGRQFVALLLFVALTACKNNSQLPPIEQLEQPPSIKLTHHTVSKGDTLYSIAWRYGMDYKQLATINNIGSPYTIYIGQKVALGDRASSSAKPTAVEVSPGVEVVAIADDSNAVTVVSETTGSEPPVTEAPAAVPMKPAATTEPRPALVDAGKSDAQTPEKPDVAPSAVAAGGQWMWPASGRIIATFAAADPLRKGVDVAGKPGDPVVATRSGNVVYAGNGLAGYGELVIVKHDEQYLSAYGNNSKLLVKEGESVKAGQKIAEIGSTGTDTNKLHFEIRKQGKPVDPLLYLPKR